MKKTMLLLTFVFILMLQTACDNKALGIADEQLKPVESANVWIDKPLDGSTVTMPKVAILAHGFNKTGISEFKLEVDGESGPVIAKQNTDLFYGSMAHYWIPESYGWHTLKIIALNISGNPAASAEVMVFVEESNSAQTEIAPAEEILEEPTETPTLQVVEESYSRCDLFDPAKNTLTLHDIPMFTTNLMFSITLTTKVPGLEEPIVGDFDPWEYSAILGETASEPCTYEGYTGRIYCTVKDFPPSYFGSNQPLNVNVNGCDKSIFSHERVSILKPACEENMVKDECIWTAGKYECIRDNCKCDCY
ncbi:MAG: hypothetical protein JEZ06_13110 [Anaerolineaceae bacterium]|nr:hypothetical protein [Anaerolineaceae bacterium]